MNQEQVGRQLNVGVLFLINEVKLSIYRFLTLGAKNAKKQPRPIELRVDRLTSCWVINAWKVTFKPRPVLDQTLIGNPCPSIGNARLLKKRENFCISQPNLDQEGITSQSIPYPVEPISQCLNRFTIFYSKTYLFFSF